MASGGRESPLIQTETDQQQNLSTCIAAVAFVFNYPHEYVVAIAQSLERHGVVVKLKDLIDACEDSSQYAGDILHTHSNGLMPLAVSQPDGFNSLQHSETTDQTPPSEATDQTPSSEITDQTSQSETTDQTPPSEATDQTPPSEATDQTPPSEATDQTPPSIASFLVPHIKSSQPDHPSRVAFSDSNCQKPGNLFELTNLLERENKLLVAALLCSICRLNPRGLTFLPCGHAISCRFCYVDIINIAYKNNLKDGTCPRCKKEILATVDVHWD